MPPEVTMLLPVALSLLAACPKPTEPATPAPEVAVGPRPATPVSHLRCTVTPPGDYAYRWWRDGLETPHTGPVLDGGHTASAETWECRVSAPGAPEVLGSDQVVITGAEVIPAACPSDSLDRPDVPPSVRSEVLGGWDVQLYECEGPLGASLIYTRLETGARDFAKYAPGGRVSGFSPLPVPASLAEAHRGAEGRDWAYFAIWDRPGACLGSCTERWQFYAVQPDGLNLRIGELSIPAGASPIHGFDDEGRFYIAERPGWDGSGLFALEDRRVLVRGSQEEVDGELRWTRSAVHTPDRPVAVIAADCGDSALSLPLYDPDSGSATGAHLDIPPGRDWEVVDWEEVDGTRLFRVELGWQSGWTTDQRAPCGPA